MNLAHSSDGSSIAHTTAHSPAPHDNMEQATPSQCPLPLTIQTATVSSHVRLQYTILNREIICEPVAKLQPFPRKLLTLLLNVVPAVQWQ